MRFVQVMPSNIGYLIQLVEYSDDGKPKILKQQIAKGITKREVHKDLYKLTKRFLKEILV